MAPKRSSSTAGAKSRKTRSRSRSKTPARSRSRRGRNGSISPPAEAAPQRPVKESPAVSMWDADAKLMAALRPRKSRGFGLLRNIFRRDKMRVWGYWVAIIVFQVILIFWAKWAVDMYKTYKAKH